MSSDPAADKEIRTHKFDVINRQQTCRLKLPLLRRIITELLKECSFEKKVELSFCLVTPSKITRLNEDFLKHGGPTDVITFDYSHPGREEISGEVFVCIEEAVLQAIRYRTFWQSEVVRYLIHGVLHLCGYDDQRAPARREMKRAEDKLLAKIGGKFDLRQLGGLAKRKTV